MLVLWVEVTFHRLGSKSTLCHHLWVRCYGLYLVACSSDGNVLRDVIAFGCWNTHSYSLPTPRGFSHRKWRFPLDDTSPVKQYKLEQPKGSSRLNSMFILRQTFAPQMDWTKRVWIQKMKSIEKRLRGDGEYLTLPDCPLNFFIKRCFLSAAVHL